MKKILSIMLAAAASCLVMAACSGDTDESSMASDRDTRTEMTTTTRRDLMSQVESKADELTDSLADGINDTLSKAGDVADDVLR